MHNYQTRMLQLVYMPYAHVWLIGFTITNAANVIYSVRLGLRALNCSTFHMRTTSNSCRDVSETDAIHIAELLISSYGADANCIDAAGTTAAVVARQENRLQLAVKLELLGARQGFCITAGEGNAAAQCASFIDRLFDVEEVLLSRPEINVITPGYASVHAAHEVNCD